MSTIYRKVLTSNLNLIFQFSMTHCAEIQLNCLPFNFAKTNSTTTFSLFRWLMWSDVPNICLFNWRTGIINFWPLLQTHTKSDESPMCNVQLVMIPQMWKLATFAVLSPQSQFHYLLCLSLPFFAFPPPIGSIYYYYYYIQYT